MRKLIAGMKISVDGKMGSSDGYAHWVDAWSDDYGITERIDACILGAGMYPGYEKYWTAVQNSGGKPLLMTNKPATSGEVEWGKFAAHTPHYILSNTLTSAAWPQTKFLCNIKEIEALKKQTGKDIYLVGGGKTATSLINAGIVDELHLIVYPLIVGDGIEFLSALKGNRTLALQSANARSNGTVHLVYTKQALELKLSAKAVAAPDDVKSVKEKFGMAASATATTSDELHSIVYPQIVGDSIEFSSSLKGNHTLTLQSTNTQSNGTVHLAYTKQALAFNSSAKEMSSSYATATLGVETSTLHPHIQQQADDLLTAYSSAQQEGMGIGSPQQPPSMLFSVDLARASSVTAPVAAPSSSLLGTQQPVVAITQPQQSRKSQDN